MGADLFQQNYIYISHLNEGDQYWYLPNEPDSINDNMTSTFGSENSLARSAPIFTYSNSGPRTVQVTLVLHRDMMEQVNKDKANIDWSRYPNGEDYVDALIRALQSIAVPRYNLSNKAVEPPLVAIRFGDECYIKGIVNGGIAKTTEKPILINGKYSKVTITFTVSEVDPYDATGVFANGSLRGLTRTLKEGLHVS